MNTATPRIFIAATEQNTGKTTTSLGLYGVLSQHFPSIGFIKPVGQRFIQVEGKQIDEDSVLIRDTFNTQIPIEDMSPIAVEPDFTRRYIEASNSDVLVKRIQNSFDRACWEKDFAIIEGTGHAGVGSVFDLSNAKVARLLNSKVILVTPGGIGRPIDEAAVNRALFDREGVEVIGVVMNKVIASKYDYISQFARRGFERIGLELLGVIPQERRLAEATMQDVANAVHGEIFSGTSMLRRHVSNIVIAAMHPSNLLPRLESQTLIVVPGDRDDIIQQVLAEVRDADKENRKCLINGLVLSESLEPSLAGASLLQKSNLPVILSPMDSYTIANRIHSMTIKTLPGDFEKISCIQQLVNDHVDVNRILEKL